MEVNSRDIELERQIDAYIKGRLTDEETRQLWVTLLQRPGYLSLLQTEIELSQLYNAKTSVWERYGKWFASAAAAILLITALHFFTVDKIAPSTGLAEPTINLLENLASAEVTRSPGSDPGPADSLLNAGFKAAVSGEIERAGNLFQQVIQDHKGSPAVSKAQLNLGILQYNTGNYEASIELFNKTISGTATADSLLLERAFWYLGNAYANVGQLKEAQRAVEKAYRSGKIYRKESLIFLERLEHKLKNIHKDD